MEAIAPEVAKATATSLMGTAISTAADKSVEDVPDDSAMPVEVKVGVKVSEILLSTIATTAAIVAFGKLQKRFKGQTRTFIGVAVAVSLVCAVAVAYIKVAMSDADDWSIFRRQS